MKYRLFRVALTLLIVLTIVGLTGCQAFLDALGAGLFSVTGTAVNVAQPVESADYWKGTTNTSLSLTGATITLTNVYDSTKSSTTTVDSEGSWTAMNISAGKYRITGSATGWTFIPKEVEFTGILSSAEPILAFETPSNASEILIVVEWQRPESVAALDVDCLLVIDEYNNGTNNYALFSDEYDYDLNTLVYSVPEKYTGTAATLDRDVFGAVNLAADATTPLVETIRIKSNPLLGTAGFLDGTGNGQLRYFLNAFNSPTLTGDSYAATPIPSTYATVTVMQPSAIETDGLLGIFNIALDSYEKMIGIIKIDVSYSGGTTTYVVKSYGNETPVGGLPTAKDIVTE